VSRPKPPNRAVREGPWRDASYLALDFETTGLDLLTDRVVSFGAVPVEHAGVRLGGSRHQVVDPGRPPSRTSVQIHELRPVDVARGAPEREAVGELEALLDRRILLAWFADVEISFLARMFPRARGWDRRTIDVRDLFIAEAGAGVERTSLSGAAAACGVPVASPHEALDDALVTAQLFLVLAARRERRDGRAPPVSALVRTAFA
jgi:DNA polymerase-3 subunit epsilon